MTPAKIYFASSSLFRSLTEGQQWSQNAYKGIQLRTKASGCVPKHFSMDILDLILVDADFKIYSSTFSNHNTFVILMCGL